MNEEFNINSIEELDCQFSVQEIEQAISCLKRGKSGGEDFLISEIFIETKSLLSSFFANFLILCSRKLYIPKVGQGG